MTDIRDFVIRARVVYSITTVEGLLVWHTNVVLEPVARWYERDGWTLDESQIANSISALKPREKSK